MAPRDENKMGKWGATSYIIGNTVGSGIFITPQAILGDASSVGVSLVIWLISALVSIFGAVCYVELGTSIRRSGADFAYLCYVKWHSLAFAFMSCGCIIIYPATLVIQAETFAEYVLRGLCIEFCDKSGMTEFYAKKLISFSTIWLLLYLNFFSVRTFVARFQIIASLAKLFSSLIVVGTGLYVLFFTETGSKNLAQPFQNSTLDPARLASAFFAGLFSYDGWDVLNFGAEELENPATSMLFAVIVGMSTVTVIYLSMNLSYFIVLSVPQINSSSAIATTFGQASLGNFQHIISLLVSLVIFGTMNSTLFSASRYLFAASRGRQFPSWISCINARHDSPRAALFFHVALAVAFSFVGNLRELLNYVGFSQWLQRVLTISVLLYIRFASKPVHPDAIRVPLVIPLVFLTACGALVGVTFFGDFASCWLSFAVLAMSLVLYYLIVAQNSLFNYLPAVQQALDICNEFSSKIAQIVFNGIVQVEEKGEDFTYESFDVCPQAKRLSLNSSETQSREDCTNHNGVKTTEKF